MEHIYHLTPMAQRRRSVTGRLLLTTLLLFTFIGGARAQQTLTVYDGTVTKNTIPAYVFYFDDFTRAQTVFPADDLAEMAGGTITDIMFYTTSSNIPYETACEVDVYLTEVAYTSISAFESAANCTTVYQGTLSFVSDGSGGGIVSIELDTPYDYGGGNLLIGIENTTDAGYKSINFYGQTVTGASVSGSNSSSLDNVSATQRDFIPKTTFTYIPGGGVVYYKPASLTLDDLTATTAAISWTAPTTTEAITGYAYQYKQATEGDDAWSNETTVTTTSASLTELTPSTAYNFRVKALYGTNESGFATMNFTTDCGVVTTFPWRENFENYSTGNFTNPCWVNEHIEGSGTYIFKIYTSTNGTNSTHQLQLPDQSDGNMTMLRLPEMTLPQGINYQFTLDVYRSSNYSDKTNEGIRVFASADGDISGATELAFIPRVYSVASGNIPAEASSNWYTYELPIGFSGTCYIILRGESKNGTSTYLDNFIVEEVPACKRPSGLIKSNINAHDVTLSWSLNDDTQTAWDVQVATNSAFSAGVRLIENVNVHENYVLSSLASETNYYVRVRANCGGGDVSGWSNIVSFRTPISCPTPTNLTCSAYTSTTATMNWTENGSATNWTIHYGTDETFADGTYTEENISGTPSAILTSLTTETVYYARVKAKNSEDDQSQWSTVIRFLPSATIVATVNDGMATNSDTPFPGGYVKYGSVNRSQFIIPATDLQDDIVPGSTIKRMTFYTKSNTDCNWGNAEYTVSLKEVTNTTFSSDAFATGLTTVYTGTVSLLSNKMEIFFSTGFNYNGGNLLVDFQLTDNSNVNYNYSRNWLGVNGSGNNSVYAYKNVPTGQTEATQKGPSRSSFMPKVTFHFLQGPVSCERPTSITVSNVTSSTATVTWEGEGSLWNLEYKTASAETWTAVTGLTTKSYELTSLTSNASYEVRVQTDCGGGDVSTWRKASFVTPAGIPLTEGFATSSLPFGWSRYTGLLSDVMTGTAALSESSSWNIGTYNGVFDNHAYLNVYSISCKYWLVTPSLLMEDNVQLTFDLALTAFSGTLGAPQTTGTDDKFVVLITTDNGNTWSVLRQWDNAGSTYVYNNIVCSATGQMVAIDLSSYAGENIAIAFYGESTVSNADNRLHIDNVSIDYKPSCQRPTDLAVSNITPTSADLSWTANGSETAWTIYYKKDSEDNYTSEIANTNPYTLSGLEASTYYKFYVTANCSATDESDPSYEYAFYTDCAIITQYPWTDNFDSYTGNFSSSVNNLPICWNYINTCTNTLYKGYPAVYGSSNYSHSGNNHLYFNSYGNYDPQDQYAILPEMESLSGKRIKLYARKNSSSNDATFSVGIMTDPTDATTFTAIATCVPTSTTYEPFSVLLNTYTGMGTYIAIKMEAASGSTSRNVCIDDITVEDIPTCLEPSHLAVSNVTSHTATLSWTNGEDGQNAWQICLNDDETNIINANSNPFTLTGLDAETTYTVKVRACCSETDHSEWSDPETFTTDIACPVPTGLAATDITGHTATINWTGHADSYKVSYRTAAYVVGILEEFGTSSNPTGWTQKSGLLSDIMAGTASLGSGSSWNFGTSNGVFDSHTRINIYGTGKNGWLITPEITIPTGAALSFDLALTAYNGTNVPTPQTTGTDDKFVVLISTDNMATWTILRQWDNENGSTYVYNNIANSATGENVAIDLSNYAGQTVKVAFYGESTTSNADNNLHIDNVDIGVPVAASAWQTVTTGETTTQLTGLAAETLYEVKVKGVYDTEGESKEVSITFTTDITCPVPTGLVVSTVGSDFATLNWESHADSWQICVNDNEEHPINVTDNPYSLTGLTPETDYTVKVRGYFGNDGYSPWTANVDFTTLPIDAVPADLAATDITSATAKLSWMGSQESYNLQWRTAAYTDIILEEGFEDETELANNWQMISNNTANDVSSGKMGRRTEAARTGSYGFRFSSFSNADDYNQYLISPELDNESTLEFYYKRYNNYNETFKVGYSSTDANITSFTWGDEITTSSSEWTLFQETVPSGTKYVAINYYSNYKYYLYIDDLRIFGTSHDAGEWQTASQVTAPRSLTGLTAGTKYEWQVQGVDYDGNGNNTDWSESAFFTTLGFIELADDDSSKPDGEKNADLISDNDGVEADVKLAGRTLWKDGAWNTICLPFDLTLSGSVLDGDNVDVRTLSDTQFNSSTGELTLYFTNEGDITKLYAGTPYIIKWSKTNESDPDLTHLINPTFASVTVSDVTDPVETEYIDFIGIYAPTDIYTTEKTKLYLGDNNTLFYPWGDTMTSFTINAFRGYFQLKNGLTAGETNSSNPVKAFVLNFDGERPTGLTPNPSPVREGSAGAWYDIQGRKLDGKPLQRGIYIHNGKKVVIK